MGVEHPYVKECGFRIRPKVAHAQVAFCALATVGRFVFGQLLTGELLQRRFDLDVIVALLHASPKEIDNVVVPTMNEAAELADLPMIHRVSRPAQARLGQLGQRPAEVQQEEIVEVRL